MNRHASIFFSAFCLLIAFIPCQLLAASITEDSATIGKDCTAMGFSSTASGTMSVAMGHFTTAGGQCSLAGGRLMQLSEDADNTFVWGHADSAQPISTPNAFLIFPAGTEGSVGIGTVSPLEKVHIREKSDTLGRPFCWTAPVERGTTVLCGKHFVRQCRWSRTVSDL